MIDLLTWDLTEEEIKELEKEMEKARLGLPNPEIDWDKVLKEIEENPLLT